MSDDINIGAISEALNNKADRNILNLDEIGQAILDKKVEVEALLEQNGYAKFTWNDGNKISKLLICFGRSVLSSTTNRTQVIFSSAYNCPIEHLQIATSATVPSVYTGNYALQIDDVTDTGFYFHTSTKDYSPISNYIAIGY